ncbi:MAG TPA: 3',5'-nucleoside bisphosphate phosphatase [Paenalcaligenes sp.]|nr:3',5'-nucleoside bisphosphate phosphatase [Paenalcaligenes sp.]
MLNVDLHSHSTVSDGTLTPAEVAQRAHAHGVDIWALTDHDEVAGLDEAKNIADTLGIQFIPGVEVSVTWLDRTVHIVGLGVDSSDPQLIEALAEVRKGRTQRAQRIGERLHELGIEGAYEGALAYATNPELVSRTHFARFLVDNGYSKNMKEVFRRYLGDDKAGHVHVQWATLEESVRWINGAGGKAVIAHPGRYKFSQQQFELLYEQFKEMGGVGIEVVTGSHPEREYEHFAAVARRFGFEASCGSDFHWPRKGRMDIGKVPPLPRGLTPVWHDWIL